MSINPCIDAVLMEVADPGQIAGISNYSHDPRATSISLKQAQRFLAVDAVAEDVLAAQPDLVLAGPHVAIQTIAALRRLGIPLAQFPVAESIADSEAQITAIAARIGRPAQGAQLNARIDAALVASHWSGRPVPALIWQGSGLVPGKGTLADELLAHTGFTNMSSASGLKKWDILPLEGLLGHPPAVLLAGEANMGAGNDDGNRMLNHPVLRKARGQIRIANYPSRLLHCGGPVIISSALRLAQVRRDQGI
ncbi:MAG: ABC transporter substrate-binding protein [Novosphingobium sp.]